MHCYPACTLITHFISIHPIPSRFTPFGQKDQHFPIDWTMPGSILVVLVALVAVATQAQSCNPGQFYATGDGATTFENLGDGICVGPGGKYPLQREVSAVF
jgi:hypothetical protein